MVATGAVGDGALSGLKLEKYDMLVCFNVALGLSISHAYDSAVGESPSDNELGAHDMGAFVRVSRAAAISMLVSGLQQLREQPMHDWVLSQPGSYSRYLTIVALVGAAAVLALGAIAPSSGFFGPSRRVALALAAVVQVYWPMGA